MDKEKEITVEELTADIEQAHWMFIKEFFGTEKSPTGLEISEAVAKSLISKYRMVKRG